jgi:hypothetical protein
MMCLINVHNPAAEQLPRVQHEYIARDSTV